MACKEYLTDVGGRRVLVVDDDRDLCDLLGEFLTEEGYDVIRAYRGEDALRAVSASAPDVVLLDLLLPDVSGLSVARQIRSDRRTATLPIVVASGDGASLARAREFGPSSALMKPFTLADVHSAVRQAVGNASV